MEKSKTDQSIALCGGDLSVWIEQEAIHIKSVDKYGDPVELSESEARFLAAQLLRLADKID